MSNIVEALKALVTRVLEGTGYASHAQRRAAFDNIGLEAPLGTLIEKVAKRAHKVTDEDIAAVRARLALARTKSSRSWSAVPSARRFVSTIRLLPLSKRRLGRSDDAPLDSRKRSLGWH